jgi:hypothetical protein
LRRILRSFSTGNKNGFDVHVERGKWVQQQIQQPPLPPSNRLEYMTTISSNQAETHAVQSQATYQRRQPVQTTITGETHNPLPQHHKKRRIPRNTESQNVFQLKRLTQSNLHGEDMAAKDSESFRDTYPPHPGKNSTIITFQNIGPQRFSLHHQTSTATSRAFKDSQAGIALYA